MSGVVVPVGGGERVGGLGGARWGGAGGAVDAAGVFGFVEVIDGIEVVGGFSVPGRVVGVGICE